MHWVASSSQANWVTHWAVRRKIKISHVSCFAILWILSFSLMTKLIQVFQHLVRQHFKSYFSISTCSANPLYFVVIKFVYYSREKIALKLVSTEFAALKISGNLRIAVCLTQISGQFCHSLGRTWYCVFSIRPARKNAIVTLALEVSDLKIWYENICGCCLS